MTHALRPGCCCAPCTQGRLERLFDGIDLTGGHDAVKDQLLERGVPSRWMAGLRIRQAIKAGLIPDELARKPGDNQHWRREEFDERVRQLFKDPTLRLDRPLTTQVRERGGKPGSAQNMAKRARALGLLPPGFSFPTHEPRDMLKHPDGFQRPKRERPAPRPRPAVLLPSVGDPLRHRSVKDKPADRRRDPDARSNIEGDAIRPRCPNAGCDWTGNVFRLARHLDMCPWREEEE